MDDGHLDIWILSVTKGLDYFRYLFYALVGRPGKLLPPMLSAEHTVSIKSKRSVLVQVDGDVIGKTPVEIEVLHGALTVLVPDERITLGNL